MQLAIQERPDPPSIGSALENVSQGGSKLRRILSSLGCRIHSSSSRLANHEEQKLLHAPLSRRFCSSTQRTIGQQFSPSAKAFAFELLTSTFYSYLPFGGRILPNGNNLPPRLFPHLPHFFTQSNHPNRKHSTLRDGIFLPKPHRSASSL